MESWEPGQGSGCWVRATGSLRPPPSFRLPASVRLPPAQRAARPAALVCRPALHLDPALHAGHPASVRPEGDRVPESDKVQAAALTGSPLWLVLVFWGALLWGAVSIGLPIWRRGETLEITHK